MELIEELIKKLSTEVMKNKKGEIQDEQIIEENLAKINELQEKLNGLESVIANLKAQD